MFKRMQSMKSADELFEGFAEKHANLIVIVCWLVIFVAGLAVLFTTTGTQ